MPLAEDARPVHGEVSVITTIDEILNRPARPQPQTVVARLAGVSKTFGPVRALHQVDLDVHAGEVVAVLGPNGAGKTTAVKLLLGLASANAGTVSVFGGDPACPSTVCVLEPCCRSGGCLRHCALKS